MKYKLLALDLDGTLLKSDKTISAETAAALKSCKEAGMRIVYITARSHFKAGEYLKGMPCDGIAYYNGAAVYARGALLDINDIPSAAGIRTMEKIQAKYPKALMGAHLAPFTYFNGTLCNSDTGEQKSCALGELPSRDIQRIRVIFEEYDGLSISELLTEDMFLAASYAKSVYITHKNATKSNALKRLSREFQIPLEDTLSFGDDISDIDMLQSSGKGVAMENAPPTVKAAADAVCGTNDNDGIAKWLRSHAL